LKLHITELSLQHGIGPFEVIPSALRISKLPHNHQTPMTSKLSMKKF